MPYSSLTSRTDSAALIPEDVSREIIKDAQPKSAALTLFKHRRMTRAQQRMPVLSLLPTAYFVEGDTGLKQTSEVNWTNKYLNAEELAVIVPIPEKVLDDVDYDLWAEIKPEIAAAIAVALDNAIFFGTNKPTSWPDAIVTAAVAAGNTVTAGTSAVDIAEDINQVMATVEADGFDVNGFWARQQFKSVLRGLRDANNMPIYKVTGIADVTADTTLFDERLVFSKAGLAGFATGSGNYHLIAGDWSQGILGVRQDMTYKMLDQASLYDASGTLMYALAQQDMVALRVVARFAWQVANPLTRMQQTEANRYPFSVLVQA